MSEVERFLAADFDDADGILSQARITKILDGGLEVMHTDSDGGWSIGSHSTAVHCSKTGFLVVAGRIGTAAIIPCGEDRSTTRAILIGHEVGHFAHLDMAGYVNEWIGLQCQ